MNSEGTNTTHPQADHVVMLSIFVEKALRYARVNNLAAQAARARASVGMAADDDLAALALLASDIEQWLALQANLILQSLAHQGPEIGDQSTSAA